MSPPSVFSKAMSPSSIFSVFIFLDLLCLCLSGISKAQDGSPCEELRTGTNQNNTSHTREGSCRLLSYLRKEVTVAIGRVMGLSIDEGGCYRIVIDEILKADELLLGGDTTFEDLTLGDSISWPIFRTVAN